MATEMRQELVRRRWGVHLVTAPFGWVGALFVLDVGTETLYFMDC
jgi:hypothetical protein